MWSAREPPNSKHPETTPSAGQCAKGTPPSFRDPKSRCWGGLPHRWYGVSAWTHLADGECHCPPLCRPGNRAVQSRALLAQPTKGKEGCPQMVGKLSFGA